MRKRWGENIRYFQCGEYGELLQRPHHHVCLFNMEFIDAKLFQNRRGNKLYRSAELEKLWPHGYSTIGKLTLDSAAYVARYVCKKIVGDMAKDHYSGKMPEYITMSRRPGIASKFVEKYSSEIYTNDRVFSRRQIPFKPPRYYDSIYDTIDPKHMEEIKCKRKNYALESAKNSLLSDPVKEQLLKLKYKRLIRPIEEISDV